MLSLSLEHTDFASCLWLSAFDMPTHSITAYFHFCRQRHPSRNTIVEFEEQGSLIFVSVRDRMLDSQCSYIVLTGFI